ncbi:hypothetical protein [Streptomyces sp. G-G2]|uniref:hypothetical protein n=1 Tax=Streptomyces sp. G-G2 TaxID=3046201 RepID=UPI0024B9556F|nr:hypothetical protein [Streptomyces sp. G-G2]MDJ0381994.1 hypothetical protein [Streptomyces sp. G-G2]
MPGLDESNAHSAELAHLFAFTMGERPLTPVQQSLATRIQRYRGAFARYGAPLAPGRPLWPRAAPGTVMPLSPTSTRPTTSFAADHQCAFWNGPHPVGTP